MKKHFLKHSEVFILTGIIILGFALRIFAIHYGLPRLYLEDEEFFVKPALDIANGAMSPEWFGAPAQPQIYAMGFLFRMMNAILNAIHHTQLAASQNYDLFRIPFQIMGRLLSILAGTAIPVLAYCIGRLWNKRVALIGGLLTATSFYLVLNSYIIRPDILQTLLLLGMMYCWLKIMDLPQQKKWYVMLGICLGLAVNTKYPSLFFLLPVGFVIGLLVYQKKFVWKSWIGGGVVSLIVSFLSGPFLYLHLPKVLHDVSIENRSAHGGHDGMTFFEQLQWYTTYVLQFEVGTLVYGIALATILFTIIQFIRKKYSSLDVKLLTIIIAAASYLTCIAHLHLHWERWMIPVMTLLFIIAAIGIEKIYTRLQKYPLIFALLCILIFAGPAMRLTRTLYGLSHPYTVELSREWIIHNLPTHTKFVGEPFSPELPQDQYSFLEVPNLAWKPLTEYQSAGITHAIITEKVYGVIDKGIDEDSPGYVGNEFVAVPYYKKLLKQSELVYEIHPHSEFTPEELLYSNDLSVLRTWEIDLLLGPYVKIYRLPQP